VLFVLSCSAPSTEEPVDLQRDRWQNDASLEDLQPDSGPDLVRVYEGQTKYDIRVLTFNAERYFDDICDSGRCDEGDYEVLFSKEEFQARGLEIANTPLSESDPSSEPTLDRRW